MSRTKILFTTKIFVNTYFVLNKAKIEVFNTIMKGEILMSKKIYLSPSMQSNNMYAYGGTNEMIECNKIAQAAKNALERCGFDVKKAPQGQSTLQSVKESNAWNTDLHIPIHTNAFNGETLGGTLVMIYSMDTENKKAGQALLDAVSAVSPGPDYALRENCSLVELNSTKAVAVYVEVEFHDTISGATWIIDNTEILGEAIAKGVCSYFGVTYKENSSVSSGKIYRVQIGAFSQKSNAENCLEKAKSAGFTDTFIVEAYL